MTDFLQELTARKKAIKTFRQKYNHNFIGLECPCCSYTYGLDASVLYSKPETFRYKCPYCGTEASIEKD